MIQQSDHYPLTLDMVHDVLDGWECESIRPNDYLIHASVVVYWPVVAYLDIQHLWLDTENESVRIEMRIGLLLPPGRATEMQWVLNTINQRQSGQFFTYDPEKESICLRADMRLYAVTVGLPAIDAWFESMVMTMRRYAPVFDCLAREQQPSMTELRRVLEFVEQQIVGTA